MSYDIYIGQAVVDVPCKEELEDGYTELTVRVKGQKLPGAPTFPGDDMTGNGNSRHPGYSQWAGFLREAGLHNLFLDKESGLMVPHPGTRRLTPHHASEIEEARKRWEGNHPGAEPGWCLCKNCHPFASDEKAIHRDKDGVLARLIWLEWWVKWALKNCKIPAIHNR